MKKYIVLLISFILIYCIYNNNKVNHLQCCVFINSSVEPKYQVCYQCSSDYTNETNICPAVTICPSSDKDFAQFIFVESFDIDNCKDCH